MPHVLSLPDTDWQPAMDDVLGMNPEEICRNVHALLHSLPTFERPADVRITDGLYFFYERGEASLHGPDGRVVRVGNHPRSDGTLVRRLQQHYRRGKNGSVFRKFLGGALMRAEDPDHPCLAPAPGKGHWERQDEKPCERCRPVEQSVSLLLRARFRFRCVSIPDRQERNHLEAILISSLSACPVCRPSGGWLGQFAYSDIVRRTGLWNSQFVGAGPMSTGALRRFTDYATSMPGE